MKIVTVFRVADQYIFHKVMNMHDFEIRDKKVFDQRACHYCITFVTLEHTY